MKIRYVGFEIMILGVLFSNTLAETWKRIRLYDGNNGESATYADFNRDGKKDVAAGMWWWEGPEFKTKHAFATTGSTALYPYDFNGDGWMDLMMYSGQGGEGYIYLNPKNTGIWQSTKVLDRTDGENPDFLDVNGDGKPEAFVYKNNQLGWYEADWSNPLKAWKFVSISPSMVKKHNYCHGYGYGDLNKDGLPDILESDGWWEQPKSVQPIWKFHPYQFGIRNGIKYFPYQGDLLYGTAHMYTYDVNGDGRADVVSSLDAHGWGLVWYEQLETKLPDGSPDFLRHMIINTRNEFNQGKYSAALSQMHAILLRDVDEDGLLDIVTGKRMWPHGRQDVGPDTAKPNNDPEPNAAPVLYWFKLKRQGTQVTYTPHLVDSSSGIGTQFEMGDIDGDGHLDIITASQFAANVLIQKPPFPIPTGLVAKPNHGRKSVLERSFSFDQSNSLVTLDIPGPYKIKLFNQVGLESGFNLASDKTFKLVSKYGPGVYFIRIEAANEVLMRKVILLNN